MYYLLLYYLTVLFQRKVDVCVVTFYKYPLVACG